MVFRNSERNLIKFWSVEWHYDGRNDLYKYEGIFNIFIYYYYLSLLFILLLFIFLNDLYKYLGISNIFIYYYFICCRVATPRLGNWQPSKWWMLQRWEILFPFYYHTFIALSQPIFAHRSNICCPRE